MTVNIADAQSRLPELIAALKPGDAVVITANDRSRGWWPRSR